jgi:hypothetical protein
MRFDPLLPHDLVRAAFHQQDQAQLQGEIGMAGRQITAEDARQRIEPGWNRLTGLLAGIPEELYEEPSDDDGWSVKVLVGHIAYWERNAAHVIQLMAGGQKLPSLNADTINTDVAAKDATRPVAEVWQELDDAHEALLTLIDKTGAVDSSRLAGDTWDHYPEHIDQLERWRANHNV